MSNVKGPWSRSEITCDFPDIFHVYCNYIVSQHRHIHQNQSHATASASDFCNYCLYMCV